MSLHLLCLILFLGGDLAASAILPKLSSVFGGLEKVKGLVQNSIKFIDQVRKHVLGAVKPSQNVINKLKETGKKLMDAITKFIEYLKTWEDHKILGIVVKPVTKEMIVMQEQIEKTVKFLHGAMTSKDKESLHLKDIKDIVDTEKIKSFISKVAGIALGWLNPT